MSSTVRLSTADARVLRGLIKAFQLEEQLVAFEKQARALPGEMELPLDLFMAARDALFQVHPELIDKQLTREGIDARNISPLLLRLGLPMVGRTLDPAGHSVYCSSIEDDRYWFCCLYTPEGTYKQALEAFRTAFFPQLSAEEWAVWQGQVRIRTGRYAHSELDHFRPQIRYGSPP